MSTDVREILQTVPAELTKNCQGLALDMGGSALKFVFRTKEDVDEITSNPEKKFSRLHLVTVGRSELLQGLDYVKQRAYLRHEDGNDSEPQTLFTTGVGCTEFGKLICQKLNARIQNLTEFDCFVKSFYYLASHMPRHELLEAFNLDAVKEPVAFIHSQISAVTSVRSKNLSKAIDYDLLTSVSQNLQSMIGRPLADGVEPPVETPLADAESDIYPCMLAICGSGFGWMQIEKDGTFKMVDGLARGGRTFCAIGSFLTGSKDFDEIVELASAGDNRRVDQYTCDMLESKPVDDQDDSMYKVFDNMLPGLLFNFGKVLSNTGEYKREDLARAWVYHTVLDLTQSLHSSCLVKNVRRVFFCGGFCRSPLVRQLITAEMARRNMYTTMLSQINGTVIFDFIKPGQHLGAIGCMVNNVDKFLE